MEVHMPQGEGAVSGMVSGIVLAFSSNTLQWRHTDTLTF